MNFISVTFLIFLAATLLSYFLVPLKYRWYVLLLSSIYFYILAGWEKIVFVLAAALIAYITGRTIEATYASEKEGLIPALKKKKAKGILVIAVILILLMLVYTKVGENIVEFLYYNGSLPYIPDIIIPLGISYYTFSIIGYMADVYWKKDKAEHNFLKLLLYMIYFPQILQGPIPRHRKLAQQLIEGHPFDYKSFCYGLQRGVWGYFKKMVIADRFAVIVNEVFTNYTNYEGLTFIVAVLASAIQLYCDFSGCMDIVLGVSECMSIHLDENFQRPFFAKSAAEFWRRWHITLGTWFKDYVYMPLVISPRLIKLSQKAKKTFGNRFAKSVMSIIPLAIVWFLTGLWHGSGTDYIAWGCYWGTIIILTTVFAPEIKKLNAFLHIDVNSRWWQIWQMVRTFMIFCGGRLLTAPGDLEISVEVVKGIFSKFNIWIFFDGSLYSLGLDRKDFWVGILSVLLLWFISIKQEQEIKIRDKIASYPIVLRWAIYYVGVLAILILGMYGSNNAGTTFVYMQY